MKAFKKNDLNIVREFIKVEIDLDFQAEFGKTAKDLISNSQFESICIEIED